MSFKLFDIWTEDDNLSVCGASCDPLPIRVDFGFILPEVTEQRVTGETQGVSTNLNRLHKGDLSWDGSQEFFYGANGDGHIEISLSNEKFNTGIFGLNEGRDNGGEVGATVSLISEASVVDVPEPRTQALLGLAFLALAAVATRRRVGRRG